MIYWKTIFHSLDDGYSYASRNISSRLRDVGVVTSEEDIVKNSLVKSIHIDANNGIVYVPEPECDFIVNNCLPTEYTYEADYVVGFSYWETSRLPTGWVKKMNLCNEIWTASKWAAEVFVSSGVTVPVFNFDLGVDIDIFKYCERDNGGDVFRFLSIGHPCSRKNTQLVIDSFLNIFDGNMKYRLVIKSSGRNTDKAGSVSVYEHSQIDVIDSILDENQMFEMYKMCHCFVYPTSGEGWGMSPVQAISTGLPTICSNVTGCTEFAFLSIPLECEIAPACLPPLYIIGDWGLPTMATVCDKMLYAVNNYQECKTVAKQGSAFVSANFNWNFVVNKYRSRIMEII